MLNGFFVSGIAHPKRTPPYAGTENTGESSGMLGRNSVVFSEAMFNARSIRKGDNEHWSYLDNSIIRDVALDYGIRPNLDIIADLYASGNFRSGGEVHVISDNGETLDAFGPGITESDVMSNGEILTYNGVACDEDPSVVKNVKSGADLRFGAYVNAPFPTGMVALD
jgi:hypothetical protein